LPGKLEATYLNHVLRPAADAFDGICGQGDSGQIILLMHPVRSFSGRNNRLEKRFDRGCSFHPVIQPAMDISVQPVKSKSGQDNGYYPSSLSADTISKADHLLRKRIFCFSRSVGDTKMRDGNLGT